MAKHGNSNSSRLAASAQKARARNVRIVKVLAAILVVASAFVAGFALRGEDALLELLGMTSTSEGSAEASGDAAQDKTLLAARVAEVETILNQDSLDTYDLESATSDVLEVFVKATKDPYLRYYDAESYANLVQDDSRSYAGVGVLFSEYNGHAYAVDVFEGSPAQDADVREGDFVVAIDGNRMHDWTSTEVAAALKRDEGEDAVITWRRPSNVDDEGGKEFTTSLPCSKETAKNVETELSETVGYIKLKQITQNSASLVKEAVKDLESQGARSFVLDIRDNPGGYLTQAVDIASLFAKSGTIVKIQTNDAEETTKNATGATITNKPLVLLVNNNTAASAEALAAALQDNQRATLVGVTTLGKGSVQVTRELSFGGALRYTAAYYKSPSGKDIDGVGVVPDVKINLSSYEDNQKTLAIETAQSLAGE